MGTVHTLFASGKPPSEPPPPCADPHEIVGDCAWCRDPVARMHMAHDGPSLICSKCLLKDCNETAWDSERRAIWHVLAHPFNAALGKNIRVYLESVMKPDVTYAETFAYFSQLKSMLDASQTADASARASAETALHEARGMMAAFLKFQRQRT